MSYCRYGAESDFYVFASTDGNIELHGPHAMYLCVRQDGGRSVVLGVLEQMRADGWKVSQRAIDRLSEEIEEAVRAR